MNYEERQTKNWEQQVSDLMSVHWRAVGYGHGRDHPGIPEHHYADKATNTAEVTAARHAAIEANLAACDICTIYSRAAELHQQLNKERAQRHRYELEVANQINHQRTTIEKLKRRLAKAQGKGSA